MIDTAYISELPYILRNDSSSSFALYPSHDHFILLTVGGPSRRLRYRFQSALHPSCIFPPSSAISVRLFRGSDSFTFPVDSMRKPPASLYKLFGAGPSWIALTQNSLHSLHGKLSCLGSIFRACCIRLSVVENNARGLANVCEPWRFASRIMLSTTYALRSATSAKSCRGFYCGPSRYMR